MPSTKTPRSEKGFSSAEVFRETQLLPFPKGCRENALDGVFLLASLHPAAEGSAGEKKPAKECMRVEWSGELEGFF
jgi:hypothetical protein